MKIGIIGAGNVGGTLGKGWAARGHEISFGLRDSGSAKSKAAAQAAGANARAASVGEAVRFGEMVALTTPWAAAKDAVSAVKDWAGKVLIDCTNPIGLGFKLDVGFTTSAAEQIAEWAKGARVVKAFNMTGAENMASPQFASGRAAMLVAGDDAAAKKLVLQLATGLGFDAVDAGPLTVARYLEPLAMLWIGLAYQQGLGRNFAFGLLRR
jgi:predicted dinucleotide-binding enzyme